MALQTNWYGTPQKISCVWVKYFWSYFWWQLLKLVKLQLLSPTFLPQDPIKNNSSWSSGHAEQLLFSCLCSKVTVYSRKLQCFFLDHLNITLSPDIRVHRAGSQLKMSESQTKAGNQRKFEKNKKFEKIWKFENLKIWNLK